MKYNGTFKMMAYSAEEMSPERASHEYFETCCVCDDEFSSDGELSSHLLDHANEEPYRTRLQDLEKDPGSAQKEQPTKRTFTQRSSSPEVWEIVSDESDDESKTKVAKTSSSSNFRLVSGNSAAPTTAKENGTTYNCSTCKAICKDAKSYREHLLTHNKPRPFLCQICNKKFAYKGALRQHLQLHISEKQYECETCHKKFSIKSMLRQHEETHKIEQRRTEPVITRSKIPPQTKKP